MNTLGSELVTTIMTLQVLSISPDKSLRDAREIMTKHCIRHITIVDKNGKLLGIISKSDVDKFYISIDYIQKDLHSKLIDAVKVEHLMTKNVHTLDAEDTIKEAAEILSLSSYHALPVMNGSTLIGIVTSTDLILYLLKNCNSF